MASYRSDNPFVQPDDLLESRVTEVLSDHLAGCRQPDEYLAIWATLMTRLEKRLSTWVGTGGARAISVRAGDLTTPRCSIFPKIRFEAGAAALDPSVNLPEKALADKLDLCVKVYVENVFKVVEALTGRVLIDPLIEEITPTRRCND